MQDEVDGERKVKQWQIHLICKQRRGCLTGEENKQIKCAERVSNVNSEVLLRTVSRAGRATL